MRTIILTKGLPASGKSSFAKELMKKEPDRFKRVNRDDLRAMMDSSVWSRDNEEFVVATQNAIVANALKNGYDVILDNTHLVSSTVKKVHRLAESIGDIKVIEKCFNTPVEECLRRNSLREGVARVPDKVINDMARGAGLDKKRSLKDCEVYYPPRNGFTLAEQDETLPRAILCDLDGTLAHIGDRTPYDATDCDIIDRPNIAVIECVLAMYAQGVKVIFMSGRDLKYREPTMRFINEYVKCAAKWAFPIENDTRPSHVAIEYQLYMRGEGDIRKDSIVKEELFTEHVAGKYNVLFVLDDRDQVCYLWRSMGLSCFQVAEGNFLRVR